MKERWVKLEPIEVIVYDLDNIPEYRVYEKQRQENELERQSEEEKRMANENERKDNEMTRKNYYNDIKEKVDNGEFNGKDGMDGEKGDTGLSAYEIALENGFSGTKEEWIVSLHGVDGTNGKDGLDGVSPTVNVKKNTDTEYILTVTDKNGSFDTPNLKGKDGTIEGDEGLINLVNTKQDQVKYKTITLELANWSQNQQTQNYEYDIEDETITANTLIEGYMDLENQAKMIDGYIESYEGGYKIITSQEPLEAVIMNIAIQKVMVEEEEVSEE